MRSLNVLLLLVVLGMGCKREPFVFDNKMSSVGLYAGETLVKNPSEIKDKNFKVVGQHSAMGQNTWKLKSSDQVIIIYEVPQKDFESYRTNQIVPIELIYKLMKW
jgi:hypothetical protein